MLGLRVILFHVVMKWWIHTSTWFTESIVYARFANVIYVEIIGVVDTNRVPPGCEPGYMAPSSKIYIKNRLTAYYLGCCEAVKLR